MTHCIIELSKRYPQLLLPIEKGARETEVYRNAVLRGRPFDGKPDFSLSPLDSLSLEQTPAGPVEVLYLADRGDFEHALRALAYRCEPAEILPSVGASTVRGLNNWEKIHRRRAEYLAQGGTDWGAEFRRFTADRRNYQDTLILLSAGEYSAVPAGELGLDETVWMERSLCIRKHHELTHFVCRTLFPEDVDAVRDEILADLIGLYTAFGRYEPALARRFLGLEARGVRQDGRLRHYVSEQGLPAARDAADQMINDYAKRTDRLTGQDTYSVLLALMKGQPTDNQRTGEAGT